MVPKSTVKPDRESDGSEWLRTTPRGALTGPELWVGVVGGVANV